MSMKKIELLAPAGDLEKLKIAVLYGADAVYIGGANFSLRAKARNFDEDEMKEGMDFAHAHGVKVYVTANIFAHNEDFEGMAAFFLEAERMGADALIISDPGVFSVARETVPNMDIHISTQANNTNFQSALFWHKQGANRIVVARELSLTEIKTIRERTPEQLTLEAFVHGAMCISYSGRCLLSNYMSSRDANKGECSQPCRWDYRLVEKTRPDQSFDIVEEGDSTYIFNAKDLCMIEHIPELVEAGITSFKIEGRVKTCFYVGTVVQAYRQAIDAYYESEERYKASARAYFEEVTKASYRGYTTGFYFGKPSEKEQIYTTSAYIRTHDFIGMVVAYDEQTGVATIEQRNKFVVGDEVEFFRANGTIFSQIITEMYDAFDNPVTEAPHPQQIIRLKTEGQVEPFDMMRKEAGNK